MNSSYVLIPLAALLVIVPGLAWTAWLGRRRDPAARLADSIGVSLSLAALAGMLSFFLRLRVPGIALWLLAAGLTAGLGWAALRRLRSEKADGTEEGPAASGSRLLELLPFVVLAALVAFRFVQAAGLTLPAWVDSVHHTLLVRLILERGGLPQTFEPVMPVPLIYHAGFHVSAAVFAFFSGLEPAAAVLVFGQLLNAGVGLAVYRLGMALWGDGRRALLAMVLVGFVFQMPAYYLTWGRYTLLAGVLLLALGMAAALEVSRGEGGREARLRLAVLTGGLLLTHYYAALVFALFLAVLAGERALSGRGYLRAPAFRRLLLSVAAGGLLALPWVLHVLVHARAFLGIAFVPPGAAIDQAFYPGYLEYLGYLLGPYRSHVLHTGGLAGLLLLGWREKTRLFAIFTAAFALLSLPWGVQVGPFRPDHAVILAFLPASLLLADVFVSTVSAAWKPGWQMLVRTLFWVGLAGLLVWGVRDTRRILNPATLLADHADVAAMAWIRANTDEDSVFLINTAGWQGGAYRGIDGGWWISPLTGRRTALPPALYIDGGPEYAWGVIDLARRTAALETCDAAFWEVVGDAGADYVYLRDAKGSLRPAGLLDCEGVTLVYRIGGVFIYRLDD